MATIIRDGEPLLLNIMEWANCNITQGKGEYNVHRPYKHCKEPTDFWRVFQNQNVIFTLYVYTHFAMPVIKTNGITYQCNYRCSTFFVQYLLSYIILNVSPSSI